MLAALNASAAGAHPQTRRAERSPSSVLSATDSTAPRTTSRSSSATVSRPTIMESGGGPPQKVSLLQRPVTGWRDDPGRAAKEGEQEIGRQKSPAGGDAFRKAEASSPIGASDDCHREECRRHKTPQPEVKTTSDPALSAHQSRDAAASADRQDKVEREAGMAIVTDRSRSRHLGQRREQAAVLVGRADRQADEAIGFQSRKGVAVSDRDAAGARGPFSNGVGARRRHRLCARERIEAPVRRPRRSSSRTPGSSRRVARRSAVVQRGDPGELVRLTLWGLGDFTLGSFREPRPQSSTVPQRVELSATLGR